MPMNCTLKRFDLTARSPRRLCATVPPRHALSCFGLVGVLGIVATVPARSSVAKASNPVHCAKALSKANAQGQRIYQMTRGIMAETLPNLNLARETENEIRTALNAGLTVIAHTDNVSVPGWAGSGYIIFNPETGSGAYKISGGGNGGFAGLAVGTALGAAIASLINTNFSIGTIASIAQIIANPVVIVILSSITILLSMFSIFDSVQGIDGPVNTLGCFLSGLWTGILLGLAAFRENATRIVAILALVLDVSIDNYASLPTLRECGVFP